MERVGARLHDAIETPLDGSNVTKSFQKLLARAGLPKRRFHDLRHSCATLLLVNLESLIARLIR